MSDITIPDFYKIASKAKKDAARIAAVESVKFFKDSFRKGGFTNTSFVEWKSNLMGSKTLYQHGTLMGSIRKVVETDDKIVIESNTPYSEIHNQGGYITVTPRMKKFFWAKYYEFAGNIKKTKKGTVSKAKRNLKTNAKAKFFKNMALMKVGAKIQIPQRQFMGESVTMMQVFETLWQGKVELRFKQHLNSK